MWGQDGSICGITMQKSHNALLSFNLLLTKSFLNFRLKGTDHCSVQYADCQVERLGRKPYTVTPCIREDS